MRLTWNEGALNDLEEIRDYIEKEDPFAAARVILRLRSGLEQLTTFPQIGRSGRVPETRELVFSDLRYIAIYRVHNDKEEVEILNLLHTAREYPAKS